MKLKKYFKFLSYFNLGQKINYIKYLLTKCKTPKVNYHPITLSFVVSPECTLKCSMCHTHSEFVPLNYPFKQNAAKMLGFELFKSVINRYNRALRAELIGGGEPLLNENCFKMIDYASKKTMLVMLQTNGTLLTKETAERLLRSRLNYLGISINGVSAQSYNLITGNDEKSYELIINNVKRLIFLKKQLKSSLKISFTFVAGKSNYNEIPQMIEFAAELGADTVRLINYLPIITAENDFLKQTITADDTEIISFIKKTADKYGCNYKGLEIDYPSPFKKEEKDSKYRCDTYFRQFRVDGDGRVGSCSVMNLRMPDDYWDSEKDPFNNNYFQKMRLASINNQKEVFPEVCRFCLCNLSCQKE